MSGTYEIEQARLLALWDEVESQESPIGSESEEEPDFVDGSDHNSESEEDAVEEEVEHDMHDEDASSTTCDATPKYYVGKDGTKWSSKHFPKNVRTRAENIITHLPGVKGVARDAKTPVECFQIFISPEMLEDIVRWTNIKIRLKKVEYDDNHLYVVRDTDTLEIKALFGLLYLAGVFKSSRLNLEELWSTDGTGISLFRETMSLQRFIFLLSCLCFDNIENREERRQIDKMTAIRAIFERFVQNSQNAYTPSEYLTIDEKLEAFRGRCAFRQYMPNKPARYGLKIFALVDSKSYYVLNLELYVGLQPEGPFQLSNKPTDVVLRLIAPISGSKRNVTFDNWFTSYEVMLKLLKEHKITAVGTVRKNKRQIPQSFVVSKNRGECSSKFGFQQDITLVSYAPRKGKIVLLMSTLHHTPEIDASTGEKQKPEIITFYNATKSGVDVVDELSGSYDVSRNSKRWPLTTFYALLNCAGINARVVFQLNNNNFKMKRRQFLKTLAIQLLSEYKDIRASNKRLPRELQASGSRTQPNEDCQPGKRQKSSSRCEICPRKKDRKTAYRCASCCRAICLEHSTVYCDACSTNKD